MDKLDRLISDTFTIMMPLVSEIEPDVGICGLKNSAAQYLINNKQITCKIELQQFKQIKTVEQLEMFLKQYQLDDSDMLAIYRDNFLQNG